MSTPQRLQLSRHKGFNLQEVSRALNGLDAVNCARPGKWGNPFVVGKQLCNCKYRGERGAFPFQIIQVAELDGFVCDEYLENVLTIQDSLTLYKAYILHEWEWDKNYDVEYELSGRNLACYCKPSEACHCDVLLQIIRDEYGK